MSTGPVETARRLAEEVLLPDAEAVDAAARIPQAHLAALDAAGLTGLAAADATPAERFDVTAALAGGCLSTAFVWIQHQGALGAVRRSGGPVAALLPDLTSGRRRAGIVITAVRGPEPMRLRPAPGGWTLSGAAPWVTGWGVVDVLLVAAVLDDPSAGAGQHGAIATVLVDVEDGMRAERAGLLAANASATVTLTVDDVHVREDRLVGVVPAADWAAADAAGLAPNGALAIGVAGRAAALAGSEALLREVADARAALLEAATADLPAARAAASALAVRAATALAVTDGSRGLQPGSRADRLLREAHFLLAFGSRPAIRADLLRRLGA